MKEYEVRIADHEDGTFSIISAFSRNSGADGLVPVGNSSIVSLLRRHFKNEDEAAE